MMDERQAQIKALAGRLEKLQRDVSAAEGKPLSDNDFAKRYLPFSSSTLSRLRAVDAAGDPDAGKSRGLNLATLAEKLTAAEDEAADSLAALRKARETSQAFVQTKAARAVQTAVRLARQGKGRRVVPFLARTGSGKSEIGKMLASRGAVYIEGRQSWKSSYKAFCADIARAAGRPMRVSRYNEHDAEERMLLALAARDNVLYIDEAGTLSAPSVNALKLIVNATGTTVVIAMVPGLWERLCEGAEEEVAQLLNRCQPILLDDGICEADAEPFFKDCGLPPADLEKALPLAVAAANEFGAFKSVVALADALRGIASPTYADVERLLKFSSKNLVQMMPKKGVVKCSKTK